jgi:hypothetical protein
VGSSHTSDYSNLTVPHSAWVFQTMIFRSCEIALRLPRKRRALSTGKFIETAECSWLARCNRP